jgi:hypothetical protein
MRRFLNKLLRDFRTTCTARNARRAPRRAPLQVESLEARMVLSSTSVLPGFVTNELNALTTSIDQRLFHKALPLVGTALNQVGNSIVGTFEKAVIDGAQAAVKGSPQAVQAAIIKDLGKGAGSILQGITTTTDGKGGFTTEVHLHDRSVLNTPKVDLNLGLPGLPIHFAAHNLAVGVQAGYDIVLDFGMHNGSPFLQTKADPSNKANPLGVALNVSANIAPGSSISATLGGLTATLTQPTTLPVSPVNADIARTGSGLQSTSGLQGSGILHLPPPGIVTAPPSTFSAGLDFGFSVSANGGIQFATPQLSGAANINLQAALTLGDNPTLPSITAGLNVNWTFNSADPTQSGLLGNAPTVSFSDVTVDLGSFLSNVVGPVVSAVQTVTKPLDRVAHVLTDPLPGITDLTNKLGLNPITLASLIGGSPGSSLTTFADVIEFINAFQIPASGSIKVDVGSFHVADARQANSPATNFVENSAVQQNGLLGAAGGQTQSSYSGLQTQADFDFPMLDNPVGFVSSVLLGQQVDLVKANLGVNLSYNNNVDIQFGLPGIASVGVNFSVSLGLDAGATFVLTDGFLVGGSLVNSVQVQNAHMDASLTLGAGGSAWLLGVHGSVDGAVGVNFDVGLANKKTGSTTVTVGDLLNGNASLNVTTAQLTVGIKAEVDVGGLITLWSFSDPLYTENLLTGAISQSGGGAGGGGGNGPTGGGGHHQLQ